MRLSRLCQLDRFELTGIEVCFSVLTVAGDLAVFFRYGFDTGHRPENLAERQLSNFVWARPRPFSALRVMWKQTFNRLNSPTGAIFSAGPVE